MYEIGEGKDGTYIPQCKRPLHGAFPGSDLQGGCGQPEDRGTGQDLYYVASVTAAYRQALDQYLADPMNDNFELAPQTLDELTRTSHRHYSPGFFFGPEAARQSTDSAAYLREWGSSWVRWKAGRTVWRIASSGEKMVPGRYPGGAVPDGRRSIPLAPEWIENEAGEACAVHAARHGALYHPDTGAAPHEPSAQKNTV